MNKARKLIEQAVPGDLSYDGNKPPGRRQQGAPFRDFGPPYHVDMDCAGEDALAYATATAEKYGLTLIPRGPNGFPVMQGTIKDLAALQSLNKEYQGPGGEMTFERHPEGGSNVYFG